MQKVRNVCTFPMKPHARHDYGGSERRHWQWGFKRTRREAFKTENIKKIELYKSVNNVSLTFCDCGGVQRVSPDGKRESGAAVGSADRCATALVALVALAALAALVTLSALDFG